MTAPKERNGKERVIDLVRKLLAHAESANTIGSMEEAMAFTEKASALLQQHKLGMTDLELEHEDEDDPLGFDDFNVAMETQKMYQRPSDRIPPTRKQSPWMAMLARALCEAHFCHMYSYVGSKTIQIIGRDSDRVIVKYLFTTLASAAYRMGIVYEKKVRNKVVPMGQKVPPRLANDFRFGFVKAIMQRLRELRREVEQQGGQFAVTRFHNADVAVQDYIRANRLDSGLVAGRGMQFGASNSEAIRAGYDAGMRASLHGGLQAGSVVRQGTISRGGRLLKGGS